MAQLIIDREGDVRVFELREDQPCCIGRGRDANVQIDDPGLSRRHCEVSSFDTRWMLRDLGSVNGTFCNNMTITTHFLRPGDRIQLGRTVLTFIQPDETKKAAALGAHVIARPDVYEPTSTDMDFEVSRKLRNFQTLLEITKAVNSQRSQEQLLQMIIDAAIELTSAQRGFLVLEEKGETVFKVARDKHQKAIEHPEKQISRSVIANVFQTGEAVVTLDAQQDLAGISATIANLDIRSLLAVPLKVHDRVIGCVNVDSAIGDVEFGPEQMNLLQAFADQAAVAVENQRLFNEATESREQERRVRQIFQKYVPEDVVRRALDVTDAAQLSSKQTVTVLFSDIRGFTSLSERMEPEEVVLFLNDYLQRMVAIVFDEGGIVDKFIGDAVMAVFGAPFPKPDDALRAVRAASRMLMALDQFNFEQAERGAVQLRIGIGVHTGPVIAGNIGSDRKMEYTVIGDTVNIASRVQDLTKEFGVEVIITHGCYEATRRRVPVKALPPVHVKGKEHALQVYQLLRSTEAAALQAAGPPPRQPHQRPLLTPRLGGGTDVLDAATAGRRSQPTVSSSAGLHMPENALQTPPVAGVRAPPPSRPPDHGAGGIGEERAGALDGLDAPTLARPRT